MGEEGPGSEAMVAADRGTAVARWTRRLLIFGVVLIVLVVGISVFVSVRVGMSLVHPERVAITMTPADLGMYFRDIVFSSKDNVELHGWWMPAAGPEESPRTIILAHGYGMNRLQDDVPAMNVARELVRSGYNVLTFDFRNHGQSGDGITSVGQYEVLDLEAAYDYVTGLGVPGGFIGVLGWSMGAVTALETASRVPGIDAVVADSPFADLQGYLSQKLSLWTGLPDFPFTPIIIALLPKIADIDPARVSPARHVAGMGDRPLLLIHGVADDTIHWVNSRAISAGARNAGVPVDVWEVSEAGHVGAFAVRPEEYLQRVVAFFDQAAGE